MKLKGIPVDATPKFRCNWVFLLKPAPGDPRQPDKKPQYRLTALFEPGQNIDVLKMAAKKAVEEAYGTDPNKWPSNLQSPFKDQGSALRRRQEGTEYLPDGYVKGATMLEMHTVNPPGVVKKKKGQPLERITDEAELYSGMYGVASVVFKVWTFGSKTGVTCYLQHFCKLADGKPLSSRATVESAFSAIEGEEEEMENGLVENKTPPQEKVNSSPASSLFS